MSSAAQSSLRRQMLWYAVLDAEYNAILWNLITDRYTRWDDWFRMGIQLASGTTTLAAWSIWTHLPWAWKIISGIGSIAAVVHPRICPNDRLQRMSELVGTWKRIAVDFRRLWAQDSWLKDETSWSRFQKIEDDALKVDETRLPVSEKMKLKAAEQMLRSRGLPTDAVEEVIRGRRKKATASTYPS
jgi:hypothetical protein